MTEENEVPNSPPTLPRCPFLGTPKDPNVFVNSPARVNFCHKSAPGAFPSFALQKKICLSSVFTQCPVYIKPDKGRIPDDLRWRGPLSLEGGVAAWASVPLLVAGFMALIFVMGSQNNWWQSIPLTVIQPEATQMVLTSTSAAEARQTELPAGFLLVIPSATMWTTGTIFPTATPTATQVPFLLRIFPNPTAPTSSSGDEPPVGSPTPRLTLTPTPTRTGSPTATATKTRTPTLVFTSTPIPSFTFWPTATATLTPTYTNTPTSIVPPSDTPVPTPTNTVGPTPTRKFTPKPTHTPKPSPTPTNTLDPSQPTPTPRPTDND